MNKEEPISVDGEVLEALPNATFKVKIKEEHSILATISGKIRINFIKVIVGDKVRIEMSPYDLTKGRIVFRYNDKDNHNHNHDKNSKKFKTQKTFKYKGKLSE